MSNYYRSKTIYVDVFHDKTSSLRIRCATSPAEAKELGNKVIGLNAKRWDKKKKDVMMGILRAKFVPGSELAKKLKETTGKSLAKAGRSTSFAIGMTIHNKNIWPKSGNLFYWDHAL